MKNMFLLEHTWDTENLTHYEQQAVLNIIGHDNVRYSYSNHLMYLEDPASRWALATLLYDEFLTENYGPVRDMHTEHWLDFMGRHPHKKIMTDVLIQSILRGSDIDCSAIVYKGKVDDDTSMRVILSNREAFEKEFLKKPFTILKSVYYMGTHDYVLTKEELDNLLYIRNEVCNIDSLSKLTSEEHSFFKSTITNNKSLDWGFVKKMVQESEHRPFSQTLILEMTQKALDNTKNVRDKAQILCDVEELHPTYNQLRSVVQDSLLHNQNSTDVLNIFLQEKVHDMSQMYQRWMTEIVVDFVRKRLQFHFEPDQFTMLGKCLESCLNLAKENGSSSKVYDIISKDNKTQILYQRVLSLANMQHEEAEEPQYSI